MSLVCFGKKDDNLTVFDTDKSATVFVSETDLLKYKLVGESILNVSNFECDCSLSVNESNDYYLINYKDVKLEFRIIKVDEFKYKLQFLSKVNNRLHKIFITKDNDGAKKQSKFVSDTFNKIEFGDKEILTQNEGYILTSHFLKDIQDDKPSYIYFNLYFKCVDTSDVYNWKNSSIMFSIFLRDVNDVMVCIET